ncbi:MAG: pitrilysin family protein [Eubacteriales bacterium]|nr:pitrilysin family protein [Eubacteriales bacterium]
MVETIILSNGTRVVMEKMDNVRSVSVGVWVNAGSEYEDEKTSGISHFLEHMLFKGTTTRDAKMIAAQMDAVGGNMNAFTAKECTCFYAKVLDEDIELAVDMLSDIMLRSTFEPEQIEREKGVICDEIYMTEDNPEDVAFDTALSKFFEGTTLERPILGTIDTVSSFCRQDFFDYMKLHYSAENMVIACAGSFDRDKLVELLEKYFSIEQRGEYHEAMEHIHSDGFRCKFVKKDIEQVHICLTFPGFSLGTKEYYALAVLSNALGGSMSSRLFQTIREEYGLAYSVYTYPTSYRSVGALSVYAGCGEKQASEVLKLMLKELDSIIDSGLDEEEFLRCKQQLKGSFILGMESTSAHMNAIGKSLLLQNKEYSQEATISGIECVTIEDVEKIIPMLFSSARFAAAIVGRVDNQCEDMQKELEKWWEKHGQAGEHLCDAEVAR